MGTSVVALDYLVLLVCGQLHVDFFTSIANLASVYPFTYKLQVVFFCYERNGFVYAEHCKLLVRFVFSCLSEEEIRDFLVEFGHSLGWEVDLSRQHEGSVQGVYKILIVFIHQLVHDDRHSGCRIRKLSHH